MFCQKCGKEINDGETMCQECAAKVEVNPVVEKENKKPGRKKWWLLVIIAVVVIAGVVGSGNSEKEAELGETIEIDDVLRVSFDEGYFAEGSVYALNAYDENSGLRHKGENTMYGIYGKVENISNKRYDLNKICSAALIVDGEYESNAIIWLENDDRTYFLGYDIGDLVYANPDAILHPKDEYYCTIVGSVGNSVYEDAEEAELVLEIAEDVEEPDERVVYRIPLTVGE